LAVRNIYSTIVEEPEYRKAFAHWKPRWLTKKQKHRSLKITPSHLQLFKEGIKFMEPIVTVGEKRMHHFTPQTKQN
jgi:hypothetical protein